MLFKWQQKRKICKIVKKKDRSFTFLNFCLSASMQNCLPTAPMPWQGNVVFARVVTIAVFLSKRSLCHVLSAATAVLCEMIGLAVELVTLEKETQHQVTCKH